MLSSRCSYGNTIRQRQRICRGAWPSLLHKLLLIDCCSPMTSFTIAQCCCCALNTSVKSIAEGPCACDLNVPVVDISRNSAWGVADFWAPCAIGMVACDESPTGRAPSTSLVPSVAVAPEMPQCRASARQMQHGRLAGLEAQVRRMYSDKCSMSHSASLATAMLRCCSRDLITDL